MPTLIAHSQIAPPRAASPQTVYVGIGSNAGDRHRMLRRAVAALEAAAEIRLLRVSSIYETEPWGLRGQPDFLNLVVEVRTALMPAELLVVCKRIEHRLGRDRDQRRWGPRVIDLDLLLWEDMVLETTALTLPHRALGARRFVLRPLAELAPEARDQRSGRTTRELLAVCDDPGWVQLQGSRGDHVHCR